MRAGVESPALDLAEVVKELHADSAFFGG